jgi:hypothetical protein
VDAGGWHLRPSAPAPLRPSACLALSTPHRLECSLGSDPVGAEGSPYQPRSYTHVPRACSPPSFLHDLKGDLMGLHAQGLPTRTVPPLRVPSAPDLPTRPPVQRLEHLELPPLLMDPVEESAVQVRAFLDACLASPSLRTLTLADLPAHLDGVAERAARLFGKLERFEVRAYVDGFKLGLGAAAA